MRQSRVRLFIPLFSTASHSCEASLKWRLARRDSERDDIEKKREQKFEHPIIGQGVLPKNNQERQVRIGRKERKKQLECQWWFSMKATDASLDSGRGKSPRLPKVRVRVTLCLFPYITGTTYVTAHSHFAAMQTESPAPSNCCSTLVPQTIWT